MPTFFASYLMVILYHLFCYGYIKPSQPNPADSLKPCLALFLLFMFTRTYTYTNLTPA